MALPTTQSISRFPLPDSLDTLPSDLRERILAVQEKAGFIPNVFLMLAHRPAEFRAFFAYHDALMEREADSLTQAEKEMIVGASISLPSPLPTCLIRCWRNLACVFSMACGLIPSKSKKHCARWPMVFAPTQTW